MISFTSVLFLCACLWIDNSAGLDNGLALTPPMGWLSWAKFYCEVDCVHHPMSCINADLYKQMADWLVSGGYAAAGYTQVNVDDCWMAMQRDDKGRLQANSSRFPGGISALVDYIHNKGLKMGIYEDYGTKTCGGYPGSIAHLQTDADTFADWKVDMLKLDGCNADPKTMDAGYPQMEKYLNATKRPMIYSCSWPDYIRAELKIKPNYTAVAKYCNLWRNYDDISKSWSSISSIINYYDHNQDDLIPFHGPGHWNDPDMLVIGNPDITLSQARAQMTIWCIWSAPLLMSNDLRFMPPGHKEILLNKAVLAVNQDKLGKMGRLMANESDVGLYVKEIAPASQAEDGKKSYAIAVLNRISYAKKEVSFSPSGIGLSNSGGYKVTDLWSGANLGTIMPNATFKTTVVETSANMFTFLAA